MKKDDASKQAIDNARAVYNSLTDDQKALVTNYSVLESAESKWKLLPQTGYSGIHKIFAVLAALMGVTGAGLIRKSRKEDEE